ncbi:AsmA-like C-terminal region-containing protein [uncultured Lentibacter sp.]|uniref:YhdP family protein n=1 Tax=uncultured Lentibacter sp. TaxID=1659309 RepID=UPI0026376D77|nr:AsmA-like C-terminal region-containing protein [uncultured Lentibacter sp.]
MTKAPDSPPDTPPDSPAGPAGSEAGPAAGAAVPRGRRGKRAAVGLLSLALLALLLLGGALGLFVMRSEPLAVPEWAKARLTAQINRDIAPYATRLGGASVVVEAGWVPRVLLSDAEVFDAEGARIVAFDSLSVGLALTPLAEGALRPTDLRLSGTRLGLRRDLQGAFWISFGEELTAASDTPDPQGKGFGQIMAQVDDLLARPTFGFFERLEVADVTLRYEDERARRNWTVDGGRLELVHTNGALRARADFALLTGGATAAGVELNFDRKAGADQASVGLNLTDFPASDLATQAAALSWLEVLRAPISGALRLSMNAEGALGPLSATLQIAEGALQPNEAAKPVPFRSARTYLTYDPATSMITFDEINLQSEWVTLRAEGQLGLVMEAGGWPEAFIGQLRLAGISANPSELLPEPVTFESGFADLRLSLDPFRVELGQLGLKDGDTAYHIEGSFEALPKGWSYQVQAAAEALDLAQVLALWPENAGEKSRQWVAANVLEGHINEAQFALRAGPDVKAEPLVSFGFERVKMRFLPDMPLIENMAGQASLLRKRFAARATRGTVTAPEGGRLTVAGTEFIIPRTLPAPAKAVLNLRTEGQITAVLSLLNQEPINALKNTKLPVTLADGRASVAGTLGWTLQKNQPPEALSYDIKASLTDVTSEVIVPGRVLASPALDVHVTPKELVISGAGRLDTLPVSGRFRAPLTARKTPSDAPSDTTAESTAAAPAAPATVEGTIELSPEFVRSFRLGLPAGSVSGRTTAALALTLPRGQGPSFTLSSDLAGLGLAIPQIGWQHSPESTGKLHITGRLGDAVAVDGITLEASGLKATGAVALDNGVFQNASFERVTIGNWLNVPLKIVSRGSGLAPQIEIGGGRIDLSQTTLGTGGTGGTGADSPPILARLEELVISSGISLRGFRGEFATSKGFEGNFSGSVNGEALVEGRVVPQGSRSAFRLRSEDGGQVLKAAGLLKNATGGLFDLTMAPATAKGSYNGVLTLSGVRLKDAPAMAALLNAASVVGLIEQLNGQGILFNEVESRFQLTPRRVVVSKASAVGNAMGISMDGYYDLGSGQMDMQGVVSPFFLVNGLGAIFTRKGEGLVGFNYTLKGTSNAPQVQVNPLSIFTPGMFREIFRRPPPEIKR